MIKLKIYLSSILGLLFAATNSHRYGADLYHSGLGQFISDMVFGTVMFYILFTIFIKIAKKFKLVNNETAGPTTSPRPSRYGGHMNKIKNRVTDPLFWWYLFIIVITTMVFILFIKAKL